MFPSGAAGAALLILRQCVAATTLLAIHPLQSLVTLTAAVPLALAIAVTLGVGVITPLSCALALLIQLGVLTRSSGAASAEVLINGCVALSLLLLGPGMYSVDARLFGRRLVLPDRDDP